MRALRWLVDQILDESDEESPEEEAVGCESAGDPARLGQELPAPPAALPPVRKAADPKRPRRLSDALAEPLVDKRTLADLVWLGVPGGHGRSEAWQMLLGYRPLSRARRDAALQRKRHEYLELRHEIYGSSSPSSSSSAVPSGSCWEHEVLALEQIRRDLPRLTLCGAGAEGPLAQLEELVHDARLQALMERVLLIWSVRQPAAGYVQGHHDILLPFLLVALADRAGVGLAEGHLGPGVLDKLPSGALDEAEADCFWCLTKVLGEVADYYTEGQPGLQRAAVLLRSVLANTHGELLASIESEGVDVAVLVVRWLGCLMVRELPLHLCVRLWDTCLAELALSGGDGFGSLLVHFCAGFLASHAVELQGAPFDELMAFVQQPPTEELDERDLEALISRAYVWRTAPRRSSQSRARCPYAPSSSHTTYASPVSTPPGSSQASEAGDSEEQDREESLPDLNPFGGFLMV